MEGQRGLGVLGNPKAAGENGRLSGTQKARIRYGRSKNTFEEGPNASKRRDQREPSGEIFRRIGRLRKKAVLGVSRDRVEPGLG